MKKKCLPLVLALAWLASGAADRASADSKAESAARAGEASHPTASSGNPQSFTPEGMNWVAAMNSLPHGVRMVVMEGDPARPGPYTLRLWLPASCRIAPYWRAENERLTVMLGAVILGIGDKFDDREGVPVKAGGFALVPARRHHYLWTRDVAVVQMHGLGPWAMNYVRASDDPSRAPASPKKH